MKLGAFECFILSGLKLEFIFEQDVLFLKARVSVAQHGA